MKIAIPEENLSSKEYIPNTNAPVLALPPTTSDIRFMPVDNTNDCDTPVLETCYRKVERGYTSPMPSFNLLEPSRPNIPCRWQFQRKVLFFFRISGRIYSVEY